MYRSQVKLKLLADVCPSKQKLFWKTAIASDLGNCGIIFGSWYGRLCDLQNKFETVPLVKFRYFSLLGCPMNINLIKNVLSSENMLSLLDKEMFCR